MYFPKSFLNQRMSMRIFAECFFLYKNAVFFPVNKKRHMKCLFTKTALPGFEPGNAGIRIQCLTIWR